MKVPLTSTHSYQPSSIKHLACNNPTVARPTAFNVSSNSTSLCYEPKSVLDLCRSPSPALAPAPATEKPPSNHHPDISDFSDLFSLPEDASVQLDSILSNSEDWDSWMKDLGLQDPSSNSHSNPVSKSSIPEFNHLELQFPALPEFPPSQLVNAHHLLPSDVTLSDQIFHQSLNYSDEIHHFWNGNLNFLDDLIRAAECLESKELQLAQAILARLNQLLPSPAGKPLQRAAFYFKEAIQSIVSGSNRPARPASSSEVVQAIRAYKSFSNISPIVMFSNFTANQAILEALDGSMLVHAIDFDIGFGSQWASFMKEVADRSETRKTRIPVVRITAVVPEEYCAESRLIRDNLSQFASELKIRFEIEFLSIRTFEFLSFKSIKFIEGEKTAVLLSPGIIRRMGPGFLNDLRQISPNVVVHVDGEGMSDGGEMSCRRSIIDGLEFYSTVLESLEAGNLMNGEDDCIRTIETFCLRPKILATVEALGLRATPWREAFTGARMRAVSLSQFADFQAECLLRKVQVRGFHVAKLQAEMVLCWQERALVATSAWRC